jgi:hypothetical protein
MNALAITEEELSAGPLALLIVTVIAVVTVLLIRNMAGRIKRLPPSFPDEEGPDDDDRPPSA